MHAEERSYKPESVLTKVQWEDDDKLAFDARHDLTEFAKLLEDSSEYSVKEGSIVKGIVVGLSLSGGQVVGQTTDRLPEY